MGLGEKKEIVMRYVSQGLRTLSAMKIAGITKHQYYYRSKPGKRGRKPAANTLRREGGGTVEIDNLSVVKCIETMKQDPDLDYGYHRATKWLQSLGYVINHKKCRRLMGENDLLKNKHAKSPKTYVRYRKVLPKGPLEVLEMDIKMTWIERERQHAFTLNVIDTFTRKWLYRTTGFSITQHHVKSAWEYLIINCLQPNDCLAKDIHIEIRNDNDKRFSAVMVQEFFKENNLNQVFTHPYTPQENAHVESFHGILAKHLNKNHFWSIAELDENLVVFREKYNNKRIHGSIAFLCPADFETLWDKKLIQTTVDSKRRTIKFALKIPRHQIPQHTGNDEPEGSPLHGFEPLDGAKNPNKEMVAPRISNNSRSNESPSVVPCDAKVNTKSTTLQP